MNEYDRHIYLYAKNWYKKNDVWEDLKKIIGERCEIDPKYVSIIDILEILIGITYDEIIKSGNPKYNFKELLLDILPEACWKINYFYDKNEKQYDIHEALVRKMLSIISNTTMFNPDKGIDEPIGEPDSNILPIRKKKE